MKFFIDKDLCISCGLCESTSPNVFSEDSDEKYVAIKGDVSTDDISSATEAKENCPTEAINVLE